MEIEAKFAVPDEATWQRLQDVKELAGYAIGPSKTKEVHDTFVDTPDRQIIRSGHVCRQREIDGQVVMTLKSRQIVEGAIHRRDELEITLPRVMPIAQWPRGEMRDRLLALIGDVSLTPLFDQHQTRHIRWVTQGERHVAEMSVDQVHLSLHGQEQAYYEVEMELKGDGTEYDLARLAAALHNDWGLSPEPRSKFARALALTNNP
jgi:inorganic triphosphatase YgiF